MKKISIYNYEAFLLDLSEGNLTPLEMEDLFEFSVLHPELEIDLNDLYLPSLSESHVQAEFKDSLKRSTSFISEIELIEYLEGNLSDPHRSDLESSLAVNSELTKELEKYQKTFLSPDKSCVYPEKTHLLKNELEFLVNTTAIAYIENELSSKEKLDFEDLLKRDPEIRNELDLFNKTLLKPDLNSVYENKALLKKQSKLILLFDRRVLSSMAAAILLLIGLIFVMVHFINVDPRSSGMSFIPKQKSSLNNEFLQKPQASISLSEPISEPIISSNSSRSLNILVKELMSIPAKNESVLDSVIPLKEQILPNELQENQIAQKDLIEKSFNTELSIENKEAISKAIESELTQLTSLEEVADEEEVVAEVHSKNMFWKKAVKLAQRVNNLGLKSINGAVSNTNQYLLSFNSFSIEKK